MKMYFTNSTNNMKIKIVDDVINCKKDVITFESKSGELRTSPRVSVSYAYHRTWEDARQHLLALARVRVNLASQQLSMLEDMKP